MVNETDFPPDISLPHFWGDVIPLVSDAFLSVLKKAGVDNIQAFETRVHNPETGQAWHHFLAFKDIKIDADKPIAPAIFRLAESPVVVVVKKQLADLLQAN